MKGEEGEKVGEEGREGTGRTFMREAVRRKRS